MRIPAKMIMAPRLSYEDVLKEIPTSRLLYPTRETYEFALEDEIDVYVTAICPLDMHAEYGRMYKHMFEQGLLDETDIAVQEKSEGYTIEFAEHEIEADDRLAEFNFTWYHKGCIRVAC